MANTINIDQYVSNIPQWAVKQADYWLQFLKEVWQDNAPPTTATTTGFEQNLKTAFKVKGNLYWLALQFLIKSPDWRVSRVHKSPTLAVAMMQAFQKLAHERALAPAPQRIALCAFAVTFLDASNELFDLVVRIYRLADIPAQCVPVIRQALEANARPIENSARAVCMLNILSYFSVRELLFPLFAQSTSKWLNQLLSSNEGKQREFLSFLDSLLADNVEPNLTELVERFRATKTGKVALNRGNLKSTILRLAKKYKVAAELCPNASRMQQCSTLSYLLHEIYVDRNVPKDDWLDMVCDFVGHDHQLQQQALRFMTSQKTYDLTTAMACAQLWNMRVDQLPPAMVTALSNPVIHSLGVTITRPVGSVAACQYYQLKLADSKIVFIDDTTKFERFLNSAEREYGQEIDRIGIDCEWRPVFQQGKKASLALLQIATQNSVHLFDMIALKKVLDLCHWIRFVDIVFVDNTTFKLGFSMTGDLGMLTDFHPEFDRLRGGGKNMPDYDMSALCLKFLNEKPEVFPYFNPNVLSGRGLTDYVKLCFGLPLDKSQQKSNWELRPLRTSQLRYAALDAFCLLEIFQTLTSRCDKLGIDFLKFCKRPPAKVKKPEKKHRA